MLDWIEVKDRLPADMEDVLLFEEEQQSKCIGYYYAEIQKFIRYSDGYRLRRVTHWMSLPLHPACNQVKSEKKAS